MSEAEERAERRKAQEELAKAYVEIQSRAESYRNLFNSIRDVIVVSDHDRRILNVNQPALREVFGYELEEVVGEDIRMLYADEDGYCMTGREIFDRMQPVKGKILEVDFRRKTGEVFIAVVLKR
jgi:PAS domain S-box-containing protein